MAGKVKINERKVICPVTDKEVNVSECKKCDDCFGVNNLDCYVNCKKSSGGLREDENKNK